MRVMGTRRCLRTSKAALPSMICSQSRSCQLPCVIARGSKSQSVEQRRGPNQPGEQNGEKHGSRAEIFDDANVIMLLGLNVIAETLNRGVEKFDCQQQKQA